MDKQREFWKHNINPITGFVYSLSTERSKQMLQKQSQLKKMGLTQNYDLKAEYTLDINSIK